MVALRREYLSGHLLRAPEGLRLDPSEARAIAEILVRLTLSFLLTPESIVPLATDDEARAFACRFVVPAVHPGARPDPPATLPPPRPTQNHRHSRYRPAPGADVSMTDTTRSRRSEEPRPIARAARELLAPKPVWVPPTPGAFELTVGIASGTVAALASPLLLKPLTMALGPLGSDPATYQPTPEEMGDPGWFGPESVAWRVHADHSLLVAGIAAFTLQALHPLAMAGVAEHSAFSDDFLGRTRRTGEFVQGVVYGSSAEAERLCRMVRKVHEGVVGVAPDGRPYAANDPELLDWVHIAEYLAIAAANRRFGVHPMSRADLDRYVAEVAQVGEGTGVVSPPRTWLGINESLEHHRPNLAVGEYAAAGVSFLDDPPIIAGRAKPLWQALWAGAVACLPPVARELLRLPMPSTLELARCRVVLRTLGALGDTPPRLAAAHVRLGLDPHG